MKIIIGLGNPGKEYEMTRHNAGHMVCGELLLKRLPKDIKVFKTNTFMNESGNFVKKTLKANRANSADLYIVHDDLDIRMGEFKIQFGRGPKDHNGLRSVDQEIGTDEYWHVRIGVDNRPLDNRPLGEEYVLQNFSDEESKLMKNVIDQVVRKLI